jgi:RNA polymerase sigma factor (sigma-70 family)
MDRARESVLEQVPIRDDSFDQFYRRNRARLVGLAFAISGSRLGSDDLVHDVMELAYRDWERIRLRDNPEFWVRRMVANRSVSAYRRTRAEARAIARLAVGAEQVTLPRPSAETDWIWREVRRLPDRQAQVVALTYVEQLTMSEIGEVLGCSKESVNTHLRRARDTLAIRLGMEV